MVSKLRNVGTANSQNEISEEGDFVVIGTYKSVRLAHEAGLAILAAGHHYWVYPVEDLYALAVLPKHAETLRREVDIAQLKNRFWPPVSIDLPNQSTRKTSTVIFAMSLLGMFTAQNAIPGLKDLGMNSSEGVFQNGEWWRIVTAITLHADLAHLAGNLLGSRFSRTYVADTWEMGSPGC